MAIDRNTLQSAINIINNVGGYGPIDATIDSYKQAADYADDSRQYYELTVSAADGITSSTEAASEAASQAAQSVLDAQEAAANAASASQTAVNEFASELSSDGGVDRVNGALSSVKNLNDISDTSQARTNLNVDSKEESQSRVDIFSSSLSSPDGLKKVGRCSDITTLRTIEPTLSGQKIDVVAYNSGWASQVNPTGGGSFVYDAADTVTVDDGISCIVSTSGKRWKRVFSNDQVSVLDAGIQNTTNDQAALLQKVIYFCASNNKKLIGTRWLSVYCSAGIIIPPTLDVDWCGMTIQQHTSMTTGTLVTLSLGTMIAPTQYRRGFPLDGLRIRGKYHATISNAPDFTNQVTGLSIGGSGLQTSDIMVSGLEVKGFRKGIVFAGPSTYLWTFLNAQVGVCWYRGISYEAATDSGENIRFIAGSVFNCLNTSFDAVGFGNEATSSTLDILFMGTSFDYNDMDGNLVHSKVTLSDCHCENNNNNPKWILNSTSGMAKTKFIARGGSMAGGPGVSGTGIPVESSDGRPSFINMTGSNIECIVDDVDFGDYYTTTRKSVVLTNVNGQLQRRIDIRPLMDGSPNAGSGIPISLYDGINNLYVPANGATTYWTLNPGSGSSISADTTVTSTRDTGSRKVTSTGGSSSGSIVQAIPCIPGKTIIAKAGIKTTGLTSGYATIRVLFYAQDGTTLIQDVIAPRRVTADSSSLADVTWYGQVPSGAYLMRFQDYWNNIPLASVQIWFSGETVTQF